jgi:plasmid maintenance system antidote protein VapI
LVRHFGHEAQAIAAERAQAAMWRGVVGRFEHLRATEGLRQSDLAAALGVSRPQIHEWLSHPRNMTLKAAGRLLLAMGAEPQVVVQISEDADLDPAPDAGMSRPSRPGGLLGALAACAALVSLLATGLADLAQAAPRPPRVVSLAAPGKAVETLGRPTIMSFWRADCGPCLVELGQLAALQAAAAPARWAAVSLDAPDVARAKLKAMGLAPRHAWALRDDPAATLVALGGAPPRLPLSVAFDAAGRICGRRTGLLGIDQVKDWARSCS